MCIVVSVLRHQCAPCSSQIQNGAKNGGEDVSRSRATHIHGGSESSLCVWRPGVRAVPAPGAAEFGRGLTGIGVCGSTCGGERRSCSHPSPLLWASSPPPETDTCGSATVVPSKTSGPRSNYSMTMSGKLSFVFPGQLLTTCSSRLDRSSSDAGQTPAQAGHRFVVVRQSRRGSDCLADVRGGNRNSV